MGFLNNLLNPVKHVRNSFDSSKKLIKGDFKGAVATSPLFNPGTSSSPKSDPSLAIDPNAPGDPTAADQYAGDTEDPAYGSFTKPFDVEEFYKYQDPGYAFRLQQGRQAVENHNSAGDGALTGAAFKDLIDYNQNSASQEYGNSFNRYQTSQGNIFSRLSALAQLGQNAAAGVGAQGTQLAGNAGQMLSNSGTAEGSGIVGAGNAITDSTTNAWLWRGMNKQPNISNTFHGDF